jgi:tetratricopeptide (TPR) repeat protein
MHERAAERSFRKGLRALALGDALGGLAHFEAAVRLSTDAGAWPPTRYLSYYGLCLGHATDQVDEAEEICRRAARREFYNPDLYLNLGRVYLLGGKRAAAHRAFVSGLRLQSDHPGLRGAVIDMGLRRRPVLPFLSRANPLNRLLGRLARRDALHP